MIRDTIYSIVAKKLGVSTSELNEYSSARDFQAWDSLFHLSLITEIEQYLSIRIPLDILFTIASLGELVRACEASYNDESTI